LFVVVSRVGDCLVTVGLDGSAVVITSTSIWTTDRAHRNGQRKSSGMSAGGKAALSIFVILVVVVLFEILSTNLVVQCMIQTRN
jgi:hypothetical protein